MRSDTNGPGVGPHYGGAERMRHFETIHQNVVKIDHLALNLGFSPKMIFFLRERFHYSLFVFDEYYIIIFDVL